MLRELIASHEWMTPDAWKGGVMYVIWHHPADYVPVPANLIEACRDELRRIERDALKALPAPEIDHEKADAGYERFREAAKAITGRFPDHRRARPA